MSLRSFLRVVLWPLTLATTALLLPSTACHAASIETYYTVVFTTPLVDPIDIDFDSLPALTVTGDVIPQTGPPVPYSVSSSGGVPNDTMPSVTDITSITVEVDSSTKNAAVYLGDESGSGLFIEGNVNGTDQALTFTASDGTVYVPNVSTFSSSGTATTHSTITYSAAPELSSGVSFGLMLACLLLTAGLGRCRIRARPAIYP